jgi:hypothetical protein
VPLLIPPDQLATIRANLGREPFKTAWGKLQTRLASAPAPSVFVGPLRDGGVGSVLETALQRDGGYARDFAIASLVAEDGWERAMFAQQAKARLMAWATSNVPTWYSDCGDKWAGAYQSFGAFAFAYAWDILRARGRHGKGPALFTTDEREVVRHWFARFVVALDTYNDVTRGEYVMTHRSMRGTYEWDQTKTFALYDRYVGGENVLGVQAARLLMACGCGDTATVGHIVALDAELGIPNIVIHACQPLNDTGFPGVNIFKGYTAGRGGTMDYLTYNARLCSILVQLGDALGFDLALARYLLRDTWRALAHHYPGSPNPNDRVNTAVCGPRFWLARKMFGTGKPSGWYESQYLGPVGLTHGVMA